VSRSKTLSRIITSVILQATLVVVLFPFILLIMNSVKTLREITVGVLTIPHSLNLDNYARAWVRLNYIGATFNTLVVTVTGVALLIIFGTMTGYWLGRHRSRFNRFLEALIVATMAIPFQGIMIPLMKVAKSVGLINSLWGLGISYLGLASAFVVFLTSGAVLSIPREIEEAATIDGCSHLGLYFRIVFPLLRTIVLTFTILCVFWFWNDYLMPQLMLGGGLATRTLQMAMRALFAEDWAEWDVVLAALVLIVMPILVYFIICQKYIIKGMISGSVKG
jgi:raffinose/stachyose/melibiose transport system permease protein